MKPWLTVGEGAEYANVSRDTIYSWVDKTDIPAHKVGRLWKFRKEEVDAWVRSGQASAKSKRTKPQRSR